MVENMIFAHETAYAGFLQGGAHPRIHSGKDDVYVFLSGRRNQDFKIVQGCGIYERHFPHAYYTHKGTVGHASHDFIEFRGYAEEERTFDFVYLHPFGHLENLMGIGFGVMGEVQFIVEH